MTPELSAFGVFLSKTRANKSPQHNRIAKEFSPTRIWKWDRRFGQQQPRMITHYGFVFSFVNFEDGI
jgi:hypothetical protein